MGSECRANGYGLASRCEAGVRSQWVRALRHGWKAYEWGAWGAQVEVLLGRGARAGTHELLCWGWAYGLWMCQLGHTGVVLLI